MGKSLIAAKTDRISKQLGDFMALSSDIDAAAVISIEGLTISCVISDDLDEERLAAMSAAMLALGERIAFELGRGTLDQVIIRGDAGYAVMMTVNERAVLCALAGEEAKLGLVILDMQRAATDLLELV